MSLNQVILIGNLTRDPEIKYTPKGTAVASLSVAVNESWKTSEGEKKEKVTFVECNSFGKQAETIGQYFKKGRSIIIIGKLAQDQWEDKDTGKKRSKLYVIINEFQFPPGSSGSKPEQQDKPATEKQTVDPSDYPESPKEEAKDDDDLPF